MRKIGIIAAMEPEMLMLKEAIDNVIEESILGILFFKGKIGNNEVVLSLCGVGKVNASMATTILINNYSSDLIINTGIAGGISPLKTKDVVLANSLMYHDFDTTIFGYEYGQVPGMPKYFNASKEALELVKAALDDLGISYNEGLVYSGDQFVSSLEALKNVGNNALAVEMEGAAIAHVCVKAKVDFIVLRYISDIIGAKSQINDYLSFEKEMAQRSANITLKLMNKI